MEKEKNNIIKKSGIYLQLNNGSIIKYKPWAGDTLSFAYDGLMSRFVFPNKFKGDYNKHLLILKKELGDIKNKNILELGAGSGNISEIIDRKNNYQGIDISYNLLKKAYKKFKKYGFKNYSLYLESADNITLKNNRIDVCICNLSLNFFPDIEKVIMEIKKVLDRGKSFFCSVPVPERITEGKIIRGNLFSINELKNKFRDFEFKGLSYKNGAVFYFRAIKK